MTKLKLVLETLCMCVALMFFSRELINSGVGRYKNDFTNSGVLV
jgi:hypothetical protein